MKIVDVCEFYAPEGGGVRTYIHAKLAAGARHGHEVVVLAPGREDHIAHFPGGGRIVTIASPALPFDKRYGMFWDNAPVHRWLDIEQPDVIEASSPWRGAWIAARWPGDAVRSLFMHHDPLSAFAYRWFDGLMPRDAVDRRFEWFWRYLRRMGAHYDSIVCAAPSLAQRLAAGGITGTATIPMGVDAGIFSPAHRDAGLRAELIARCNLPADAVLALGVGRHTGEKRWPVVIDACAAVAAERPLGLILVGDGHQRAKVLGSIGSNPHVAALAPVRDRALFARTLASADLLRAQTLLEAQKEAIGYNRIITDGKVAKISVVGVGMKSHAGVAATMFRAMADRGINIQAISTSEIKVSVLIDEDETELAVRVLHTAYDMDAQDA